VPSTCASRPIPPPPRAVLTGTGGPAANLAAGTRIQQVLAGVAEIFPSTYIHIGGDEPRGMPHDLYSSYVERLRHAVRSLGRRPLGWQESARAGLGPDDIIQYWYTEIALAASLPAEVRAQAQANLALSRRDVETAVVELRRSRASKPRSGPRSSPTSTTCRSCCCLACLASPTRPGATRRSPRGPITVSGLRGTTGCGPKTTLPTSAPPP
jgi:hypothetical protein